MTRVHIEASSHGPAVEGELDGGRLLDFIDEHHAAVAFSCRGGTCGTCRVRVIDGAHLLSSPRARERETLAFFGDGPDVRLACLLVVAERAGADLRLVSVDD